MWTRAGWSGGYRWSMTFLVRPARISDAKAISAIRVQGWRETYVDLLSPEFLEKQNPADSVPWWRRAIERGFTIAVSEVEGQVRGFAASGPPTDDDSPRDLELWLLYQLASEHGTGSGQALLDAVIGDEPASLWVAEQNPRARAFYERNGFVADGTSKALAEWENLVEIRMVR